MKVPDGLALSEFRGYEDWQTVAVSQTAAGMNVILANPVMIDAPGRRSRQRQTFPQWL